MTNIKQNFINGMRFTAASVNIVTTDGEAGKAGATVSAFSSVSADGDKPILLVCLNNSGACADAIIANGRFCVNVLQEHQRLISDTFAGRKGARGAEKFDCGDWHILATGAPVLSDALVAFDCVIERYEQIGTHKVVFGMVEAVQIAEDGHPLIYFNRNYTTARIFDETDAG